MKAANIILIVLFCASGCVGKQAETNVIAGKENQGPPPGVLVKNEQGEAVTNSKEIDGVLYAVYAISKEGLETMFHEEAAEYDHFSCFYLDIRVKDMADIVTFPSPTYQTTNDKVHYLSFGIKDYITIETGSKTYKCINSTFDRTYGKVPYSRFFLVFDKVKEQEGVTFKFYDNYFNKGEINLKL